MATALHSDAGAVIARYGAPSPYAVGSPPIILDVSPTPDTTLSATTTPVLFKMYLQGVPLRRGIVCVVFAGMGLWEIAHNGEEFTPPYRANSTREAITDGTYGDGYQFSLLRAPQWPDSPKLIPFFINEGGEENA